MMWFYHPFGMGGGWFAIVFGGFIVLAVFIGLVIWAFLRGGRYSTPRTRHDTETPEEILKRRYASGEITQKEYREMLSEIKK